MFPLQDLFDMTAKPVRDLLYSKSRARLVVPTRLDSIREIEIEQSPSREFGDMRLPIDMKELTVLVSMSQNLLRPLFINVRYKLERLSLVNFSNLV